MITDALPTEADRDGQIALICEEISDRLRAGQEVNIDDVVAKWPQYADELRDLVPAMRALAQLPGDDSSAEGLDEEFSRREPLGDFRIERVIGRGGMGVVYEAWQLSLQRRVALKVLPLAAVMDPRHLARFKNEALAAAALNHPHIVPVYGVGEARGTHYYAMQLIRGQNLAQVIAELRIGQGLDAPPTTAAGSSSDSSAGRLSRDVTPAVTDKTQDTDDHRAALTKPSRGSSAESAAYFRNVARLIRDAAEALGSAHAEGVIHRDVKPSNLMLDARGKLWVTDFGLAQMRGGENLTMTGDLVGTLRYMSPEQVAGKHSPIDHRTDIYSLGATLYELLTLRPLHSSANQAEVLRQIAEEEPVPPRRQRKEIPPDLETIVLQMTFKAAADRYPTMRDVEDELDRFLNDRPIKAKPIGIIEHSRRVVRKHSVSLAVALGLSLFVSAALGVAFWTAYVAREEALLKGEDLQRQNEQNTLIIARMNLTVGEILDQLASLPQGDAIRQSITEQQLAFYEELSKIDGQTPAVRNHLAYSLHGLGHLQIDQFKYADAETTLKQSIDVYEQLADSEPANTTYLVALSHAWMNYGRAALYQKKWDEAAKRMQESVQYATRAIKLDPNSPASRMALAFPWGQLGLIHSVSGRSADSFAAHQKEIELHLLNVKDHPGDRGMRTVLGSAYMLYGASLRRAQDYRGAKLTFNQALELFHQLERERPEDSLVRSRVLETTHSLYYCGEHSEEQLERICDDIERLINDEVTSGDWRNKVAWFACKSPQCTSREAKLALTLALRNVEEKPAEGDLWKTLGVAYYRLGDWVESLAAFEKSDALIVDDSGIDPLFESMCYEKLGQHETAVERFRVAEAQIAAAGLSDNAEMKGFRLEAAQLLGVASSALSSTVEQ